LRLPIKPILKLNLMHRLTSLSLLLGTSVMLAMTACNKDGGGLFGKKKEKSSATGWNYDDKNYGNFHVIKNKEPCIECKIYASI